MIPKINNRGHSFKDLGNYLLHDKGAQTSKRVAWTRTGNMYTDDPEKAFKVMAWTDLHREEIRAAHGGSKAGRKAEAGNAYHPTFSWAVGEEPSQAHQVAYVEKNIKRLGLSEHEYVLVAHNDTDHIHVHAAINLVHPETGLIHVPKFDKERLQKEALEYEREHGLHCHMREENAAKKEQGEKTKHQDRKRDYAQVVTQAYKAADCGKAFEAALAAEGLVLAAARRGGGFVLIDKDGDIQKLARQLDLKDLGLKGRDKTAAINAKLSDLDRESLPDAYAVSAQRREEKEQHKAYLEAQEARRTEAKEAAEISAHAAFLSAQDARRKSATNPPAQEAAPARALLRDWAKQERELLAHRHHIEREHRRTELRDERKKYDASKHRQWDPEIEKHRRRKLELEAKLEQKGLRGLIYSFRHGAKTKDDIAREEKSLLNAQRRLDDDLQARDEQDDRKMVRQEIRHRAEKKELEARIDTAMEAGEIPKEQAGRRILSGKRKPDELNIDMGIDMTMTHE